MKKNAYIACLGVIATLTVEFGVIGILPKIADYYQISIEKAGRLLGVYELVAAISGPFMALLVSNINRKKVMIVCLRISVMASIISSLSPAFSIMLVLRILVALTDSVFHSVTLASVITNKDEVQDTKMMSIVLSGFSIAAITIIPLSSYVGNALGWQLAFVIKALVSGIALFAVVIVFPSMPVTVKKTYKGQLSILKKPLFLWSATLCFFMLASAFSLYSYFADYLGEQKRFTGEMISYMLLLFGAAGILGNWLCGKLASKYLFEVCLLTLLSVVIVALGFRYSGNGIFLNSLVIAVWGLLFTFGPIVITSYVNRAVPEAMEFGFALTASFIGIGIAAGTSFGGWIITSKGVQTAPWGGIVFCTVAIVILFIVSSMFKKSGKISPIA